MIVRDSFCKPVGFDGEIGFANIQITPIGLETTTEEEEDEQSIVFSANGTAQTAMIMIGDGKTYYTITITAATGKAKVYDGIVEDADVGVIDLDAES